MKNSISIFLSIMITNLTAAQLFINPLPIPFKSIDNGGSLHSIDAYKDGVGAIILDNLNAGIHIDNSAMNTLVYKYGERAKTNNVSVLNEVIYGTTATAADKLIASGINPSINGTTCDDNNPYTYNDKYLNGLCSGLYYKSCNEIKISLPSTLDGLYTIDLDGTGSLTELPVYCDMTTSGGGWTRIFKHNVSGGYFSNKEDAKSKNISNPNTNLYSILNKLEYFRKNGIFTLRINWPLTSSISNTWSQSSDFTYQAISGYTPIAIQSTNMGWGGLEYHNTQYTLSDGTINHLNWYFSIGSLVEYSGGIPSYEENPGAQEVNLWIK